MHVLPSVSAVAAAVAVYRCRLALLGGAAPPKVLDDLAMAVAGAGPAVCREVEDARAAGAGRDAVDVAIDAALERLEAAVAAG